MQLIFFLIVPPVMAAVIFLTHVVTNRLGLQMRYGALAACAMSAWAVDFLAAAIFSAPDNRYFICLFALVFAAAAAITVVNKILVRRQIAAEKNFAAQVESAYLDNTAENISDDEEKILAVAEISDGNIFDNEISDEKISSVENFPAEVKELPAEKIFDAEKLSPAENISDVKVDEKISEEKKSSAEGDGEKISAEKKILVSEMKTLDEILDYAYTERARGNLTQAAYAYKKALDRYSVDDYAPFVAVDLSNVYKEQAFYMKAIKTYESALKLPAVRRNAAIQKKFQDNLDYLRVVQSVLLKNRALSTPFSQISPEHLREIEALFQTKRAEFH